MHRWRALFLLVGIGWLLLLAVRCHLPRQTVAGGGVEDSVSAVYLVRHGWHAGIAIERSAIPQGRWPILDEFPDAAYLEVGWGEAQYYPGHTRGVWGVTRAGLWPTNSVLHVIPIADSVQNRFPMKTVVRIPVGRASLDALSQYVAESFHRSDEGQRPSAAAGYYSDSKFYRSSLTYHGFNNCNHWAAGALEAAGCDTAPRWTMTVGQVVQQAVECGTLVQRRPED